MNNDSTSNAISACFEKPAGDIDSWHSLTTHLNVVDGLFAIAHAINKLTDVIGEEEDGDPTRQSH